MVPQPRSPTQSPVADEVASTGVDKMESLETDLKQTKLTYGVAYTKLIKKVKKLENKVKSSHARRKARVIASDDEDDLEDPSKQGRKISEINQDPTISLDVSTAKPVSTTSAAVTTASVAAASTTSPTRRVSTSNEITMVKILVYIRKRATKDKGKGEMDESEPVQTKTKLQQEQERLGYEEAVKLQVKLEEEERQRISRVHEAASSFNVKEWEDIQARVEADEELAQRLQAEEREMYTEAEQARILIELINQRKRGYSFDEIKTLFETTMKRVNTFVPMESEVDRAVPELAAESSKRDAKEELNQEIPKKGMNVKALQTKYPIIDWEIYTEGTRKYWKIIRVGNHTEVELKRLVEPDTDDELWKLQKHIHDLTWKLYDSCGVHHVSTEKGIDIYMLVEKEYPLSRGTLTQMLVAKLLVE
ncbi:hypothetical protein Tco_1239304 [Tanacetum coccineum]